MIWGNLFILWICFLVNLFSIFYVCVLVFWVFYISYTVVWSMSWGYLLYKHHKCVFLLHEAMFYRCCVGLFMLSLCIFRMRNIWVLDVFYYICRSVFSITLRLHVCIYIFVSAAQCCLRLPLFQVPHVYGWEHMYSRC